MKIIPSIINKISNNFPCMPRHNYNIGLRNDVFERSNPVLGKVVPKADLHLPVSKIDNLFASHSVAINAETSAEGKVNLIKNCVKEIEQVMKSANEMSFVEKDSDGYSFAADRVHEIKNPIIEVYSRIMTSRGTKGVSVQNCDKFFEYMTSRISDVVKRYEFFLDKGLDKSHFKMKDIFDMAQSSVTQKAQSKNVKISLKGEQVFKDYQNGVQGLRGPISGYKLYAVFSNLIQNAVKYTKDNSTIAINLAKREVDGKKYLEFSVADEGIGIPKEAHKRVFEGHRALNALKSGIEGTGYGLPRVKKILESINSTIDINSPLIESNVEYPGSQIKCMIRLKD